MKKMHYYIICMEKLIFTNKYLKTDYAFEEPIVQLSDNNLIKILQKENYKNEDCGLEVQSLNNLPVSDFIQIKVNVSKVGVFLANFEKEKLTDDDRKKLIEQISSLKTSGELSDEQQYEKIKKLVLILNNVNPTYVTFSNNQQVIVDESKIKEILSDVSLNTYLFLLTKPKEIKVKVVKEKKHLILKKEKNINDSDVPSKEEPKTIEVISFKDYMEDYIFFGVFCFMIPFSFLLGLVMAFNSNSLSIFLFVLSGIFFGIFSYAFYKYISDFKEKKITFQKLKFPLLMSLVGLIIGIGVSFLIGYFVIKPGEGITINYQQVLAISIPVSIGIIILAFVTGCLILIIKNKFFKNKKENK